MGAKEFFKNMMAACEVKAADAEDEESDTEGELWLTLN